MASAAATSASGRLSGRAADSFIPCGCCDGLHWRPQSSRVRCRGASPRPKRAAGMLEMKRSAMPDLADLFPGYASEWISTTSGRIFARVGGEGPPLLLLHGFPQTHVMWHKVAPQLADAFTLIIPDLPGYGWSDMPESDADHKPYTK